MSEYEEIEDTRELARLSRRLSALLMKALRYKEVRTIGYPQGAFSSDVRFLSGQGTNVFWWGATKKSALAENWFGHGTPGENSGLNIDIQFNVPITTFSRMSGGAFVRYAPTNEILLGHRGIVTLGHGRVSKESLFSEMRSTIRQVDTSKGEREYLIIGGLESADLVADIEDFATELRRTLRALRGQQNTAESPPKTQQDALRKYFDEFSGQRRGVRKSFVADWHHGKVVRELNKVLELRMEVLKSRAIDLVAIGSRKSYIFEVKTSSSSQNIYTAAGQLIIHASAVAAHVGGKPVVKVIVLPDQPNQHLRRILTKELGINILTFERGKNDQIAIPGLNALVDEPAAGTRKPLARRMRVTASPTRSTVP